MLHIDDPRRPLDRSLLDTRGGFAWWYVDALDADGTGLVCIWSWGLPFLPGDRAARLRGGAPRTGDRPSLNVAIYERGQPVFYTLLSLDPADATWQDDTWRFGDSTMALNRSADQAHLTLSFDVPVPASAHRLTGDVVVAGRATQSEGRVPDALDHAWTPLLAAAHAHGTLHLAPGHTVTLDAPAYVDRNGSPTPLDALGIDHWTWGRQVFGDTLVVHYLTWPADRTQDPVWMAAVVGPDGVVRTTPVHPRLLGARRSWLGMRWWRQVELVVDGDPLVVTYDPPVDAGPFYLRCMTTARWRGQTARGWAELCQPDRIDLDAHRFIVRMAVHQAHGPNSIWLPLFVGPRADRIRRLVAGWRGRPALTEQP